MVRFLILLLGITISGTSMSQIKFYKKYVSTGHDIGEGIVQLPDSSYVVCGSSTSFQDPSAQAFFMKIDSLGNHKWAKQYGGSETESAKRIFHTPNEGFYGAGHSNTTTTGDFDFYFFHTDESGNLLWEKKYGTQSWDILKDAIKFPDSTYLLVGDTYNMIDGEKDGYMIRLDKNGDTLWSKQSNHLGEDVYNDVMSFYDTSFVLAGKTWNIDSNTFKSYVACYNNDGTLLWENEYGLNGNFEIKSVASYSGEILAVGHRISSIDNTSDDYALIISNQGVQTYTYTTASQGSHSLDIITHYGAANNFLVSISYDNQFTTGEGQDVYIAEYNNAIYDIGGGAYVSGSFDDITGEIIRTSDNAAVAVGTNNSVVPEIPSVFVLKFGPNQDSPNTTGVVPIYSVVSVEEKEMDLIKAAIFPNPTKDKLTIQFSSFTGKGQITLTNITGQIVRTFTTENGKATFETSDLKQGIYLIKLNLEDGSEVNLGKAVVQ